MRRRLELTIAGVLLVFGAGMLTLGFLEGVAWAVWYFTR